MVLLGLSLGPATTLASDFEQAQQAAEQGNYRLVVEVITNLLATEELDVNQEVMAYSNRAIAYSLLKAYALAKIDLQAAIARSPDHVMSLNQLGVLLEQVDEDYAAAETYFGRAADAGFAPSQASLANLYRYGIGVRQDSVRALALYRASAEQQFPLAFTPLGEMYLNGEGTAPDVRQAVAWFERGVAAGIMQAYYQLGRALELGRGVAQDPRAAATHYRVAALQGHAAAQQALGNVYWRGLGTARDYAAAAHWFGLAADQDNAIAQNRLAWLLAGCPQPAICDGPLAVELANRAVAQSDLPAYRDTLAAGYARMGDYERAVATLEAMLETLPADSDARAGYVRRLAQYQRAEPLQL